MRCAVAPTWNSGITTICTLSGRTPAGAASRRPDSTMPPWLSITPLGRPVEPLV
jgi:hypothetical protein